MVSVLGISPGTRTMGLAVIHGTLTEWRIKRFPGRWSEKKAAKILIVIENVIDAHSVIKVACKINHASRRSANLDMLTDSIVRLCKRKGIKVKYYSIEKIYRHTHGKLAKKKRVNKKLLMEKLVARYPVLDHERLREHANKNPYHVKIFEAVAVAEVYAHPS